MNTETFYEVTVGRISDLVDQIQYHQSMGNDVLVSVLNTEVRDLTEALDNEEEFFYAPYFLSLS